MIVFLIIALILLSRSFYLKKEYAVTREITINKPKNEVFDYIKLLRNQNEYSYYNRKDPDTIKSYSGIDGEVGFVYRFDSKIKTIGTGTQTISEIIEGDKMCCNILFTKPLPLQSFAEIAVNSIDENETKVTWTFRSIYNYPLNVVIYFLDLEKLIGTDLASSLITMKEKLENK
ncbi:MAG: SRPBCC family protein [Flavobacterium sp.]|nr:SRPBCC family protein [Flavobacterium sp.]